MFGVSAQMIIVSRQHSEILIDLLLTPDKSLILDKLKRRKGHFWLGEIEAILDIFSLGLHHPIEGNYPAHKDLPMIQQS